MKELKGSQKKYLRGLAHNLKPSIFLGQKGLTENFINEVENGLNVLELIKIKFIDFKEKKTKIAFAKKIAQNTNSHLAGLIGHTAIYYREHKEPEKRKIKIP